MNENELIIYMFLIVFGSAIILTIFITLIVTLIYFIVCRIDVKRNNGKHKYRILLENRNIDDINKYICEFYKIRMVIPIIKTPIKYELTKEYNRIQFKYPFMYRFYGYTIIDINIQQKLDDVLVTIEGYALSRIIDTPMKFAILGTFERGPRRYGIIFMRDLLEYLKMLQEGSEVDCVYTMQDRWLKMKYTNALDVYSLQIPPDGNI